MWHQPFGNGTLKKCPRCETYPNDNYLLLFLSDAELSPLHFFSVAKAGANMQNRKAGACDSKRLSFVEHFLCFSFAFSLSAKGQGLSVFVYQSITCFMASNPGHNLISLEAGVFVEGSMEVNILVK